jgi:hypothetical protein
MITSITGLTEVICSTQSTGISSISYQSVYQDQAVHHIPRVPEKTPDTPRSETKGFVFAVCPCTVFYSF